MRELLGESPGLKPRFSEFFQKACKAAVNLARADANLDEFPASSPWSFDQAMDDDFGPTQANGPRANHQTWQECEEGTLTADRDRRSRDSHYGKAHNATTVAIVPARAKAKHVAATTVST
jgi:hypothetical protein